ncbi:hypothetical protein [Robiginitalea sp. SC105]|uniref:hypothetical protein n=1 Tax=Robiginitalea sp. SC105 TaxID=2762332 RepID=UPI00163B5EC2|nr:hypothetical protein [Robiginitalea sp. SC105]MBC2839145.1 hypothetical protein [Robiginitalea sp. SC105]
MMAKKHLRQGSIWRSLLAHIQDDWYKYVFEVIVVILGILIAFALDSWYDNAIRKSLSRSYAISLISDLEDDISDVNEVRTVMAEYIDRIDSLAAYVRSVDAGRLANLDLFPLVLSANRPYSWNRVTIDDLKQSGILRNTGNEKLSRLIGEYEAFTKHMEEDYRVDLNAQQHVLALADGIVDLNYPNFVDLATEYWNPNTYRIHTGDFSHSEAYLAAREYPNEWVISDTARVREMVNGYLRLRFFLNVRTNLELPKLISQAEEIIALLESDYLD